MAIAYTRSSAAHEMENQSKTLRLAAQLYGHIIDRWHNEPLSSNDNLIDHLLEVTSPGTTLIIANPYVLSAKPSLALSKAREAIGKGLNLVIASEAGGVPNLASLTAVLAPIESLEARIAELEGELSRKDQELAEEMDAFQKAIEEQTVAALAARGISLGALLRQPTGTLKPGDTVARPDQGRALKALRERLSFSQSDVSALLDPPVDKSVISRIEAEGSAHARYEDYELALQTETVRREQLDRKAKRGVNSGRALLIEGAADMLSRVAT
ncbi:hypothetical protein [Phyllobacterium sp. P5_D12]